MSTPTTITKKIRHGSIAGYTQGCTCTYCAISPTLTPTERERNVRAALAEELSNNPDHPMHGTTTGYGRKCRCERCVAAKRQSDSDYKTRATYKHGTVTGYSRGCKCDLCKKASEHRIAGVLAQLEHDPGDQRHGTATGYVYGCRCTRCREAMRDYRIKAFAEMSADTGVKDARKRADQGWC